MTGKKGTFERVEAEGRQRGFAAWIEAGLDVIDRRALLFYTAPAAIVLVLLYIGPILSNLYLSLHSWSMSRTRPPVWVGMANYADLLQSDRFHGALVNTLEYVIIALTAELIIGLAMALLFNQTFRGRAILRTIFLFPMMATPIAVMLAWRLLLDPYTGIFSVIKSLGGPRIFPPLASPVWVIPTLCIIDIWEFTPLVSLILLGGLSALPREPYEAASMDGASAWQRLWYITLPLLRPVFVIAILFRTIDLLKAFETVFVLTNGGPNFASETLNVYAYKEAFEYFHVGYASAFLLIYFVFILVFAMALVRVRRVTE